MITGDELWFIACLITIEVFALLISLIVKKTNVNPHILKLALMGGSFVFIILCSPLKNEHINNIWRWYNACAGIGYFYLGYYYRLFETKLSKVENHSVYIIIAYLFLSIFSSKYLGCHVDFASANFVHSPICLTLSLLAIWALVCFCKQMKYCQNVFRQLGKDTLFLFAINIWIIKILKIVFSHLGMTNMPEYLYGLVITAIALCIASLLNHVLRKRIPWIIGE
ncbi:acyltransferase family protein [Bacteroides gallinaceum]|uniref:acyltransferase family protein n=1 Tax=Bacteroides gallinaceum TaxID=1462571 RepID=UPI00339D2FF5